MTTFIPVMIPDGEWRDPKVSHPSAHPYFQVKLDDGQMFDAAWEHGAIVVRDPAWGRWEIPSEKFFKSLLPFGPVPVDWKQPRMTEWRPVKVKRSRR